MDDEMELRLREIMRQIEEEMMPLIERDLAALEDAEADADLSSAEEDSLHDKAMYLGDAYSSLETAARAITDAVEA